MSRPLRLALLAAALLALGAAAAPAAPPPLTAQPSSLDYGVVPAQWGEQSSSVWVQNDGPDPLLLDPASVTGSGAFRVSWDGCVGQTLNAGQGCSVSAGFDPPDGAVHHGTLHVPVAGGGVLDVPLSGVGGVQEIALEPQALSFGEVAVGESATRSFTLTSSGTIPFTSFVAIPTGGDVGAFRVVQDGCSLQQLVSGQSCTVVMRFEPLAAGAAAARLLLIGGENEPAMIPLHGVGTAAPPAASAPPAPTPSASAPQPAARAVAAVAFDAPASRPVRLAQRRIDLGFVRCASSERCSVTVRPRVYATGAKLARARGDAVVWSLDDRGARVTVAVPEGLRGRPALLVARLRVQASGQADGIRTRVVRIARP